MTGPLERFARWLRPDRFEEHIYNVKAAELREKGISAVILDLDNTFLPWKSSEIPERNLQWAESLRSEGIRLFVLSNTTKPRRMEDICRRINAGWLHPAAKPAKKSFLRAAELLGLPPREIAVAGDQLFTDMLGGRRAGMYLILVKPLSETEFFGTRYISRPAEILVKKYMASPF